MIKKLFIDTETTGPDRLRHGLIEISGIVELGREEKEKFTFNCSLFEGDEIDPAAEENHGYTEEEIHEFPDPVETYYKLIAVFGEYVDRYDPKDKFQFLGYGAEFDNNVLRRFFAKAGDTDYFGSWFFTPWIDVMSLAANALKTERYRMENFKLGIVANFVGIEVKEDKLHHSAYDIRLTKQLYEIIEDGSILNHLCSTEDIWARRIKNRGRGFRKNGS